MLSIDLVIPMVFPTDPAWQSAYAAASGKPAEALKNARYRSWNTEELLIKCCMKFMPWVRSIKLLLASETQIQSWMEPLVSGERLAVSENQPSDISHQASYPQVRIVFHEQFIPKQFLPTFNVNTIEMFLHKIPDLSEYFIYANDDTFPLSPLEPEDFFRPADGIDRNTNCQLSTANCQLLYPCQHHNEVPYPTSPNVFQKFVKNGLDMVAADWGKTFPRTWLRGGHSMAPMLRSTVEKVCQRHKLAINKSFTFKRSAGNFNQYIFSFWQHLSGKYIDYTPIHHYIGPVTATQDIPVMIRDPKAGIVCINDNEKIKDWEQRAAIVRREIHIKLKEKIT